MPARRVPSRPKATPPAPAADPKRTGRSGRSGQRGSYIVSQIVTGAATDPKVAGVMTFTGRKGPNLVPEPHIEIGARTTNPRGPAPERHVHGNNPKDEFIEEKPAPVPTKKKKR